MQPSLLLKHILLLALLVWTTQVFAAKAVANDAAAQPAPTEGESAVADKSDKTGTNPLNFQNSLGLKNEFNRSGDSYANFTRLTYSQPLRSNVKVSLELPLLASDASGSDAFGLGDISLKAAWIPYVTKTMGVALGADLTLPTASDDAPGAEKWQLGPSVTVAFLLPHNFIFAPAYKHNFSFAGNGARADIHQGALDFYLVWKFDRSRQWFTLDPTFLFDYQNSRYDAATVRLTYGRVLGKVGNAVLSGFIKPGIGIGHDRPNDWSLEVGVTLIGF